MVRKASAARTEFKELGIPRQRLHEFRKLAAIPEAEFRKRMENIKGRGERITFSKAYRELLGEPPRKKKSREVPIDLISEEASNWIDAARKQRELEAIPKYGVMNPRTDSRRFIEEATDELLDALNYAEWSMEKGEISFCQWVLIERCIKHSIELLKSGR